MKKQQAFLAVYKQFIAVAALSFYSLSTQGQSITAPVQPPTITSEDYSALLGNGNQLHIQDAYGPVYFTNGPTTIFEVHLQRRVGSDPFTNAPITMRIAMSTTTRTVENLSASMPSNLGLDEVVVFDGTILLSSLIPKNFNPNTSPYDISIPLTVPFDFDPAKGSLLVDFRQFSGGIPTPVVALNSSADQASRVVGYSSNAVSGFPDTGSEALQLITVPNSDIAFFPSDRFIINNSSVSIYTRLGVGQIHYTVDGTDPTLSSALYSNPFKLAGSSTVKARFFVNGFPASDVFSANFTKADPIQFTPGATLFTNSLQVALSNTFGTGIIRYTLDGTAPTAGSSVYTSPIQIVDSRTISARIFSNNVAVTSVYATNYARVYAFGTDGISMAWRQQYFGNGYLTDPRAEAGADPDADGSTNLQEFNAGTNPLDAGSGFKISVKAVPLLTWITLVNSNYNILRRPSLSSGQFTTIATIKATSTTTVFVDLDAGNGTTQDYYSIQLAP